MSHIRAMCPRCGHPNVMEKPTTDRKTLDFVCMGKRCSARYRVYIEELPDYTPLPEKGKNYLNRQERDYFLAMMVIAQHIVTVTSRVPVMPETATFAYKQAINWLATAAEEWIRGKDPRVAAQLRKESEMYTIGMLHVRDAKAHVERMAQADADMRNEIIRRDREPILDLSLATMQFCCKECDGTPACSEGGCPVKDALEKLAIPTWDAVPECPYARTGVVDEEEDSSKKAG